MKIMKQLDPYFEVLGLLYFAELSDDFKAENIAAFDSFGINGKEFYQQHLLEVEKYIIYFKKHMKTSSEPFFIDIYTTDTQKFFGLIISVLLENQQLFDSIDTLSEQEIRSFLIQSYEKIYEDTNNALVEEVQTLDEIATYIEHIRIEADLKWKFFQILKNPKRYYARLISAVKDNLPIYKQALKKVPSIERYLNEYALYLKHNQLANILPFLNKEGAFEILVMKPTLIMSTGIILLNLSGYCGVHISLVFKKEQDQKNQKDVLMMRLKAIGDRSKFEILQSLKTSPKYNLELSEAINLNPSTMSHHMNVLLSCGLVNIAKEDGKVYYSLDSNTIMEIKDSLDKLLLS